jgi:hypothetical protein
MSEQESEDRKTIRAQNEKTPVDAMLGHIQTNMFPEGAIPTAWVLVSEWIDLNGEYYALTLTDDKAPPWHHVGLLAKSQVELDDYLADEDDE